jgi:tetratricopeptide (TPR) repeat protein
LNAEANPSSYTYDSLDEACMFAGDKDCAIKNFKKALELGPNDTNATEGLRKLKAFVGVIASLRGFSLSGRQPGQRKSVWAQGGRRLHHSTFFGWRWNEYRLPGS